MYSIEEYGQMVADPVRTGTYAKALQAAVRPGSTVLDLGAGTGIFSLLACQYGARKVYAIETGDAIAIAQRIAEANGFADRIVFLQGRSTAINLPEKVDVIVSDMHGTLPLYKANIASIADARRRMLAAGGTLIPRRESLWAAVVQAPELYEPLVSPWEGKKFGLDMEAAREAVTNMPSKGTVARDQLLGEPQCWGVLDYATIESPDHSANVAFRIARPGTGHGLMLWFESSLADGASLSNAPGAPETVYQSCFLPFSAATRLDVGDSVAVRLRADFSGTDYLWSWESRISSGDLERPRAHFRQSTFFGSPLSAKRLSRLGSSFRPVLGSQGKVDAWILGAMDGATPLEEIARTAMDRFSGRFSSLAEALTRVRDLSDTYSDNSGR
jgi:protein arginine N-methyltransferase 1